MVCRWVCVTRLLTDASNDDQTCDQRVRLKIEEFDSRKSPGLKFQIRREVRLVCMFFIEGVLFFFHILCVRCTAKVHKIKSMKIVSKLLLL